MAPPRLRIVVLDGYTLNPGDNPWTELAQLGELVVHDRSAPEEVLERAAGAHIVITNKTVLDGKTLAALPDLRFISVLATGYNVVDTITAARLGVPVANVPEYGTDSVAQHTFALLFELTNQVGAHHRAVQEGAWQASPDFCFWHGRLVELRGLTMGIVGFGRIGRRVGEIAHVFGMNVLATRSTSQPEPPGYQPFAWSGIEGIFAQADVVSLHCPLSGFNERFVDATLLRGMKRHAFLINTARGGLIDEAALAEALRAGRLAGAALDVISREPMPADHPLRNLPNCILTPHLAWATLAARKRMMATTVDNVRAFLAGEPIHIVNRIGQVGHVGHVGQV